MTLKQITYCAGDKVKVYNTTLSGQPFLEGVATLSQFISKEQEPPYSEWWKVTFPSDRTEVTRKVVPGNLVISAIHSKGG